MLWEADLDDFLQTWDSFERLMNEFDNQQMKGASLLGPISLTLPDGKKIKMPTFKPRPAPKPKVEAKPQEQDSRGPKRPADSFPATPVAKKLKIEPVHEPPKEESDEFSFEPLLPLAQRLNARRLSQGEKPVTPLKVPSCTSLSSP